MTEIAPSFFRGSFDFKTGTPTEIQALIDKGANPNEMCYDNERKVEYSVIGLCILAGNINCVRFLMERYKILPSTEEYEPYSGGKRSLLSYASASKEMTQLLLSSGADRLFNTEIERNNPSILDARDENARNLLLEYEYPLLEIEKQIRRYPEPKLIKELERQKKNATAVKTWFENCTPYPKKKEFLLPLPGHEESAIITIIRTGQENLMKAFEPLEKWTRPENLSDLREIFAVVPRTDFFEQRMRELDKALILENKKQARIRAEKKEEAVQKTALDDKPVAVRLTLAQKRQALSEILSAVSSPKLKQEIDDSVRKRWGWKPRVKRIR